MVPFIPVSYVTFIVVLLLRLKGGYFASPFQSLYHEEGEYQKLYPLVTLGFYLEEDAHILPYLFGYLENIDYPKDRIVLDTYVNNRIDSTLQETKWWLKQVDNLYWKTKLVMKDENWRESALRNARLHHSDYIFLFTGKHFFLDLKLLQRLLEQTQFVSSPYLLEVDLLEPVFFHHHNISARTESFYQTESLPLLIDLKHPDVSYLTFSAENLFNYAGNADPLNVFNYSLTKMNSSIYIDYSRFYGILINSQDDLLDSELKQVNSVVATVISKFGFNALSLSAFVKVQYPKPSKFRMAQIYVINLKRRSERRKKVEKLLKLYGFDYQVWDATDGRSLKDDFLFSEINLLRNYEDPYYKRPMKAGEVGCFLSHYRIWKDVILNNYSRVIVFEDDLRFALGGVDRLVELIEDLISQHFQWDFVYLGRKQLGNSNEQWIKGIRHLSTVGYSYWTIGYMLSYSGAQKLLQNKPLKKLLPVDEYIPIMFNKHPNSTWMNMFEKRDLSAFTVFPVIVHPEKYTTDTDYISDTEDSAIVTEGETQIIDESFEELKMLASEPLMVNFDTTATVSKNEL